MDLVVLLVLHQLHTVGVDERKKKLFHLWRAHRMPDDPQSPSNDGFGGLSVCPE